MDAKLKQEKKLSTIKKRNPAKVAHKAQQIKQTTEKAKKSASAEELRQAKLRQATPKQNGSQKERSNGLNKPTTMSAVLGDVCWLLSQSVAHRYNFFLADIDWMVLPPIMHGQYRLFQAENRPFGFAVWASVSDEVEKRLEKGLGKLSAKDWKSGPHLWLIDVIAPFGQVDQMLGDLKKTAFRNKSFKYHRNSPEGGREVVSVSC